MTINGDNHFFEHIFSSFVDGVILVAPNGTIEKANPAIEEMFRSSVESLTDKPLTENFPEQSEINMKIQAT